MRISKLHDLLWGLIKSDLEKDKKDYSARMGDFYKTFFKTGHAYLEYDVIGDEVEYVESSKEMLRLFHESQLKEMYERNLKCYSFIGASGFNASSSIASPRASKPIRISFSPFEENIIDDFLSYVYPRIVFSNNQSADFTEYYKQFEDSWFSDNIQLECYAVLKNFWNHAKWEELRFDDEVKIRGFSSLVSSTNTSLQANKVSEFGELDLWLERAFPRIKKENETSYQCIVMSKTIPKVELISGKWNNFYSLARKLTFLIRIIVGGNVYFDAIGIKSVLLSPDGVFSQIYGMPGNKIPRALTYDTTLEHPCDVWLQDAWQFMKQIDYELLAVADHKYEFALKRSEMTGPGAFDDFQVYNDFDRILDLFQGIENLIAAPDLKDKLCIKGNKVGKGKYIRLVVSKMLFPDDSQKCLECEKSIEKIWKIRNDYVHGELDVLLGKYHDMKLQSELANDVSKLRFFFVKVTEAMIKNSFLIPLKQNGVKNRQSIINLMEDKIQIQKVIH